MANIRESRLRIVGEIPSNDPKFRYSRVASPLLAEEDVHGEVNLFLEQHRPDDLVWRDTVELTDPRGRIIGGAVIWEARWERKSRPEQALDAARYVLAQGFEQTQNSLTPRVN
jgi:hypothetical protein